MAITKFEYRKRRLANRLAKLEKMSVSRAFKINEVQNKMMKALGPLTRKQKIKVLKAAAILLDLELPPLS